MQLPLHPDAVMDNLRHDVGANGLCWQPIRSSIDAVVRRLQIAFEIAPKCDSPIEIILGAALIRENEMVHGGKVKITPQHWLRRERNGVISRYRFDWALGFPEMEIPVLYVECDGREWHSTEEQKANDKAKDAAAREVGIEVLRFSGSDIFRQPEACARVALGLALQKA